MEVSIYEISIAEVSINKVGTEEVGTEEVGTSKISTAEVGTHEISTHESSIAEVGIDEISIAEVGTTEVGFSKVYFYTRVLFPPLIPRLYTLFENVELLPVCQLIHSFISSLVVLQKLFQANVNPSAHLAPPTSPYKWVITTQALLFWFFFDVLY